MVEDDVRVTLATLRERIGSIDDRAIAAHRRLDKFEDWMRSEFKIISDQMKEFNEKLEPINAYINRGRGWASAAILLAGIFGGSIVTAIVFVVRMSGK